MLLNPFHFYAPKTLSEAIELYSKLENVKLQAGGTFLLNALKLLKRKGSKSPENIVCLRKVKELKGMSVDNDTLTIRAMTSINEIFDSPILEDNFGILKTVCRNISTNPIRNMASVGGNLTCRYTWTEMPATMIGLEADLYFKGSDDQEEILPAEEFYQKAAKTNKIFTHLTVQRDKKASIAYRRVKKSQFVDIPLLSVFIKTYIEKDRFTKTKVSINNCVAFAQRDNTLEEFLNNSIISKGLAEDALNHLDNTIYDTRSSDYKKHMFRVSIKSAINELMEKCQNKD